MSPKLIFAASLMATFVAWYICSLIPGRTPRGILRAAFIALLCSPGVLIGHGFAVVPSLFALSVQPSIFTLGPMFVVWLIALSVVFGVPSLRNHRSAWPPSAAEIFLRAYAAKFLFCGLITAVLMLELVFADPRGAPWIQALQYGLSDAKGRQRLARYMIRSPFALEKMRYDKKSAMVIYRSKLHATLKRNYQLMPALKWLRMLMNHIPDKYEHLVRYYGYYSNRSRGARTLVENGNDVAESIRIDEPPDNNRRKANWAQLIQKVYEVDPLKCTRCSSTMRIIALIDDAGVIERILKHLRGWDPQPETRSPAGPDPPWPKGESIPLT